MRLFRSIIYRSCLAFFIISMLSGVSQARSRYETNILNDDLHKSSGECRENVEYAVHDINKMGFTIANMGLWGKGFLDNVGVPLPGSTPSCIYPYPGQNNYLFAGALWIGAIVGQDTLVSVGADGWTYVLEMWPAPYPEGSIISRSILNPEDADAVSEQDYIGVYVDTVLDPACVVADAFDCRPHIPLNLKITQRSYAWSYSYAEDFIIFDYTVENIGPYTLEDVCLGVYVDGDVGRWDVWDDAQDDITGFRSTVPSFYGCPGEDWLDTINIAWIADNDGKRNTGDLPPCPDALTLTAVTGLRVLATPSDSLQLSYNWWISNSDPSQDWGPRLAGTPENPFRDFGTGGLGTPMGDKNKHYIMRHNELDYDQLYTGLDHTGEGWLPPPSVGPDLAGGFDTRYLLSFGPFDIDPGERLPITMAYVAGENFHTDCNAFENLFDPQNPDLFYNYLNFNDLGTNSIWASWIYDNPGVDTDGDGYRGPFRICVYDSILICDTIPPDSINCYWEYTVSDTIYTAGDGIPDFRGATPPPGPDIRLEPLQSGIRVRWNGYYSETTRDMFSALIDFEGYRLYLSQDSSDPADYIRLTSYDREDYYRYWWNGVYWEIITPPFSPEEILALYGIVNPLDYTSSSPYFYVDSIFYFTTVDLNNSDLTDTTGIFKRFPDEPYPVTLNIDSAQTYFPEILVFESESVYFKYFEYEYNIRNLLPGYSYCVSVTAFDYGSYVSEISELESSLTQKAQCTFPLGGYEISGNMVYYDMVRAVPDVTVNLSGDTTAENISDIDGHYTFTNLQPGSYMVTPSKDADDIGVSVADIVKIRRHLAVLEPFDSPYKLVAGDVNCSGDVSVADIIKMRRYIVHLENLPCGNWIFVDSSFDIDTSDWTSAQQYISAEITNFDLTDSGFIAVRLGDVNNTWNSFEFPEAKSSFAQAKTVFLDNVHAQPGDTVAIPLRIEENTVMAGFEFHINYNSEQVNFIEANSGLGDLTVGNHDNSIHIVWEDINHVITTEEDKPVITMYFQVPESFEDESPIDITRAEVADAAGNPYQIEIKSGSIIKSSEANEGATIPKEYSLEQNRPNPFNSMTAIELALPEASEYELDIYNIAGQLVRSYSGNGEPGVVRIVWDGRNSGGNAVASGIYLYRAKVGSFSATKKMVLLK